MLFICILAKFYIQITIVKTSPFVMVSAPTHSVCYTEFPCAHDSFSIPISGSFADPARVSPPDAFPSALYCPIQ